MILSNIPDGLQTIIFNYVGFDTKEIEVEFPVTNEIFIVFYHKNGKP